MRYEECSPPKRGMYFEGKGRAEAPSQGYEEAKEQLPRPLLSGQDHWLGCYDTVLRLAFQNARHPTKENGFVSSYIDAAFNQDYFLWDNVFISMFSMYLEPYLPSIGALDNFYRMQLPDGEIPREFVRDTGEDMPFWVNKKGLPLHSYFHNHYGFRGLFTMAPPPVEEMMFPDLGREQTETAYYTLDNLNHPLLAWAEWMYYLHSGDLARLGEVLPALVKQYQSFQTLLRHANGLYVTDWASMDNSPRNKYLSCGVDTSCEMVLFANNLMDIMDALDGSGLCPKDEALYAKLAEDKKRLTEAIHRLLWDEETGFFYDLTPEGKRAPAKTAAAFWALTARAATPEQAARLCAALEDPKLFNRAHRIPSCSADAEGYDPRGGYWRGSVWAPLEMMVTYGLEQYGKHGMAREIALNHMDAVARVWEQTGTIWENYPPDSIDKADADHGDFVGWSGLGPVRFLLNYGVGLVPDTPARTLRWELAPEILAKGPVGCRNFRFADVQVSLEAIQKGDEVHIRVWQEKGKPFILDARANGKSVQQEISAFGSEITFAL